jgi:2-polyprenyl-6-methoxyphenol hydroxylase-like FAD-dependent oxidoreductase
MTRIVSTPVLIVGTGAVGAILALELARNGVSSMMIGQTPTSPPRTSYINGRSMELLKRLGLTGPIRERGVDPDSSTDFFWTQGFHDPPVHVWHHPSVNQVRRRYAAVNDGTAPAEPYQRVDASVLDDICRSSTLDQPLVDLRPGWVIVDLALSADGATVKVSCADTRASQTVWARYVADCHGPNSSLRRHLDIPMDDADVPPQQFTVYFRSNDPSLRRHSDAFVITDANGVTLVSRDERDGWTGSVATNGVVNADPVATISERLGISFSVDRVASVARSGGSLTVAKTYRRGAAYLVGDAAHRLSSVGGYGENTAIADAVDLGWKLAASVNGWGGPQLLASYEKERRPVALFNRELSANLADVGHRFARLAESGASREHLAGVLEQDVHHLDNLGVHFGYRYESSPVVCHEEGEPPIWRWRRITATTWPGGRAPAVRMADGSQLFDRMGIGFTLVDLSGSGLGTPLVDEARRRGVPMTHLPIEDAAVRACWERDLVLVRPDHHVAWRGDTPPEDCRQILDRVTGHAQP